MLFVLTAQMFQDEGAMAERLLRAAGDFERISLIGREPLVAPAQALLARLGLAAKTAIIVPPEDAALWGWAQDRFLVCETAPDGQPVIVGSASGRQGETAHCAAAACGLAGATTADFWFEGGNVLAAESCLVGADTYDRALRDRAAEAGSDPLGWMAEIEGRRPVHVVGCRSALARRRPMRFEIAPGNFSWRQDVDRCISWDGSRQPVFHLDMFITPAGGRRILVGDPVLASRMIDIDLPEEFPVSAFDEIAGDLQRAGFNVIRNPLPFVYFDDPESRLREWFYPSANNCWVQCGEAGDRVWLPEYGFGAWPELKATDDANAAIWRDLGFKVERLGDFLPLVDQLGSLNCASKILERGDLQTIRQARQ